MRRAWLALLLTGCTAAAPPMPPVVQPPHHAPSDTHAVDREALKYIMRPDSDPQTIAIIRQRIKSHRTGGLRQFIRNAPHVAR